MAGIYFKNVTKSFGPVNVIKPLNLEIKPRNFVCFLGPSGCGKTTLLRMIAGLESPTSGEIYFDEKLVASQQISVPPEQRQIGMVFQNYAVWPHLNVFDNVAFPLKQRRFSREEIISRTEKAIRAVKLNGFEKRMSHQLSGGQLQRIAVARALVSDPQVLLLDEPFSNLDVVLRDELREEVKRLQVELGITTLLVTHDQKEALSVADEIVVLEGGVVRGRGKPDYLYNEEKDEFVRSFVTGAQSINWHGEQRLVSPHQWQVSAASAQSGDLGTGEVVAVLFMGDYHELLVRAPALSSDVIKVRASGRPQFSEKQRVSLVPQHP